MVTEAILMKCNMLMFSKVSFDPLLQNNQTRSLIVLLSTVLFANASRFYYLFQHHMTVEMAPQMGMIPGTKPTCNSIVTTLGPDIALLALDCRGERTKYDICNPITHEHVFNALYKLPYTVKHLVLVTGVPLIYPRLTLFEKAMEGAAGFNMATLVGKTGALGDIIGGQLNKWNGDPELLDDMNDRKWVSGQRVLHDQPLT
jgi:hypothetical protein